ncbi:peptidoglycan-binding protein, partial [Tepidibacter formicigenes]
VNGIDGIFGNGLKSAVIKFQSAHGLSADGIVGKDTRAAIDTALRNREIIEPPIGGYNIYNPNQSNYTVNVNLISKNYRSRKHGNSIKAIVIHWIGNPKSTAIANRNYFANTDRSASAHYIVGLNGEVVQAVKEENCAFHAGGSSYTNLANTRFKSGSSRMHNDWTIGVESCHEDANGNYNSKTYTTLVRLAANLLDKYNLNTQTDLLRHYDFTHKDCPKLFCGENNQNWAKFKSDVDKVRTNSINIPVTNAQMPSNVKFSSNERTITITFNKGKDSVKTILGDSQKNKLQETTGNSFVIEMPVYGQKYIVYLKSIASDGTETAWSGGYAVTTGTPSESIYLQRKLSYDPRVEILQTDLKTLGYDIGKYGADGKYGDSTEKAIKSFQKNNWIYVDGITRLSTIKTISKVLRQNNLEFYNYCKHPKVKVLQEKLHKLGLYNIKIDDKYGESTQKAVKSFQEKYLKNYLSYYKETEKLGVADPFTINHINKEYSKHVNNSGNTNNPHSNKYNEAIYKHIDESFIMQFVNTFLDVKDYWQKDFFLDTKFEKTYKINKCLSLTLSAGINKDNSSTANHINAGSLNIKNFQVDNLSLPNVTCSGEDLDNLLEKLKNLRIISDNFLKDVDLTGISFVAARPNLDDEKFSFTLFEMQYAAELEDVLQHYGIDSLPIDFNGRTLFVRATFDINIDLDDVKKGLITAEIALVAILGLIIIIEAGGVTMTLGAIYSALMPLSPIIYKFEELLQQWTPALNGF